MSLSKNPRVDKGPQPLMFNPALTTCASERMKTQRFSYFADFAARERMREAKPVKLKKVAFSHFFDTLRRLSPPFCKLSVQYESSIVAGAPCNLRVKVLAESLVFLYKIVVVYALYVEFIKAEGGFLKLIIGIAGEQGAALAA